MIASSENLIHAVWLDPFSPMDATECAQLNAAGISLQSVSTLGELALALRRAHLLIIRLGENAELLQEVQTLVAQLGFSVPILCRVDRRRMKVAVEAMRLGALTVLPIDEWSEECWRDSVSQLRQVEQKPQRFVFVDPVSQHLLALAQRVAQTDVTALLVGPTGAGKEVLARVLHESSPRAKGPFVALNCAALPEHLIEDMLFGHEKGAFTGALKEHKGLFEQAHGGTIFLDEIGEMPIQLQAKLLRVLQEKKLNRLGGENLIDVDVRVIAATNKDLKLAIEQREFREDLYFRISTFRLRIQPLRERQGDILPLVMQALARDNKDGVPYQVTPEAQAMLLQYSWPGNVRELENVVQRAVVLCGGKTITPAHLMFDEASIDRESACPTTLSIASQAMLSAPAAAVPLSPANAQPAPPTLDAKWREDTPASGASAAVNMAIAPHQPISVSADPANLAEAVLNSEFQVILAAIQSTDSRNAAAAKLGISPRTLRYKLAQFRQRGISEGASA